MEQNGPKRRDQGTPENRKGDVAPSQPERWKVTAMEITVMRPGRLGGLQYVQGWATRVNELAPDPLAASSRRYCHLSPTARWSMSEKDYLEWTQKKQQARAGEIVTIPLNKRPPLEAVDLAAIVTHITANLAPLTEDVDPQQKALADFMATFVPQE